MAIACARKTKKRQWWRNASRQQIGGLAAEVDSDVTAYLNAVVVVDKVAEIENAALNASDAANEEGHEHENQDM